MRNELFPEDLGSVEVQLPSGDSVTLFHGDIVGRLWSAALRLDDARISEAHAMVSCRGHEMKLLALRGRFTVDGRPVKEIVLQEGQELELAPGLGIRVVDVVTPGAVLRVLVPGVAQRDVTGVLTLYGGGEPRMAQGWCPDGDGWIWPTGDGWMRSGTPAEPLGDGDQWEVGGTRFIARVVAGFSGVDVTERDGGHAEPIKVIARWDTVHIQRASGPVLVLTGRSARLVSELAIVRAPVAWEAVAHEVWGDAARPQQLRRRWDMQLQRLRNKLRAAAIRTDLVRPSGDGLVELVLGPDDVLLDET